MTTEPVKTVGSAINDAITILQKLQDELKEHTTEEQQLAIADAIDGLQKMKFLFKIVG